MNPQIVCNNFDNNNSTYSNLAIAQTHKPGSWAQLLLLGEAILHIKDNSTSLTFKELKWNSFLFQRRIRFTLFLGISYKSLARDGTIEKRHEWTGDKMGQSLGTEEEHCDWIARKWFLVFKWVFFHLLHLPLFLYMFLFSFLLLPLLPVMLHIFYQYRPVLEWDGNYRWFTKLPLIGMRKDNQLQVERKVLIGAAVPLI